MRDLRNEISHEYRADDITAIFEAVIKYSEKLIGLIGKSKVFITRKGLLAGL
ncbi:MAG TPA: capsule biosynthesis protein [Nitrospinae bacterium]|nr:capsule biosynthesis protein [Nitrospinota bacterium]